MPSNYMQNFCTNFHVVNCLLRLRRTLIHSDTFYVVSIAYFDNAVNCDTPRNFLRVPTVFLV